jgi:hypothetical protein
MENAKAVVADLILNGLIDYLTPDEIDPNAYIELLHSHPLLQTGALLRWEAGNALSLLQSVGNDGLAPLRTFFITNAARDKVGRLIQYALQLVTSVFKILPPSDARQRLAQTLNAIVLNLSNARRAARTLEFSPFVAVLTRQKDPELFGLVARWAIAGFHCLDRVRWLQQHGIALSLFDGSTRTTARLSFRMLFVAHACRTIKELRRAAATHEAARLTRRLRHAQTVRSRFGAAAGLNGNGNGQSNGAAHADADEMPSDDRDAFMASLREALKQLLCMLQAAHIGKVPNLQVGEVAAAALGVLTSWDDVSLMWHRRTPNGSGQ